MPIQRSIKRRRIEPSRSTVPGGGDWIGGLRSLAKDITPPPRGPEDGLALGVETNSGVGPQVPREVDDLMHAEVADEIGEANLLPAKIEVDDADTIDADESDEDDRVQGEDKRKQHTPTSTKPTQQQYSDTSKARIKTVASPFQLTQIRDLAPDHNVDAVTLRSILGHPLIYECWQFNYLHSIPFILDHFDPDIRLIVKLKIIHGFWRSDDARKQRLHEQAEAYQNVKLIAAHMPEIFGTHHTKMMIIFRRDDVAQVVIHTANMIPQDWGNMTQAVWRSPDLPLLDGVYSRVEGLRYEENTKQKLGSGVRFKADLLRYLQRYEGRTKDLVTQLNRYDFSAVRGALIASAPSKELLSASNPDVKTAWGWPGLKQMLSHIVRSASSTPISSRASTAPHINIQISSIATLTEKWIQNFLSVLSTSSSMPSTAAVSMLGGTSVKSKFNLIFPTPDEIRNSLDGYDSGDSIHMKVDSKAQQKVLGLLRPMLRHWDGSLTFENDRRIGKKEDESKKILKEDEGRKRQAGRNRAAPHIKTYIRFSTSECKTIDWAMLTSANLSTQAWGATEDKDGKVRICSYELGVVVWPGLFQESDDDKVIMVPVFGADDIDEEDVEPLQKDGKVSIQMVGLRMPYDLPLVSYEMNDEPWVATRSYEELDWQGRAYGGYSN